MIMIKAKYLLFLLFLTTNFSQTLVKTDRIDSDNFYSLKKVAVNETGVYLLDAGNQCVFQYSHTGEYIRQISQPGQGPGEFIEPVDIEIHGDTLWILGHTLMRIGEFVNGELKNSIHMKKIPISFSRLNERFIVGQVFSTTFMSAFSNSGVLLDSTAFQGAAKKKFGRSPFPLFSTLTHMVSSDAHFYMTYEYKNAVEKYTADFQLLKSKKVSKRLKEPKVKSGGNNQWFIDGQPTAKDIQYAAGRIYVLWLKQEQTLECEGLSQISVFDEKLKHIRDFTIPDCVIGFDIYDERFYGVCEEPVPHVVIYEMN